jgi:hypothetical protein
MKANFQYQTADIGVGSSRCLGLITLDAGDPCDWQFWRLALNDDLVPLII